MTVTARVLLVVLLAASAGDALGQVTFDPRETDDPRDGPDPREGEDPRELAPDPRDPPPEFGDHVGALIEGDQDVRLARELGEAAWRVEPVVGTLVDRWIATVTLDDGETPTAGEVAKAAELRDQARRLAELADQSLRDTRFVYWVDTIFDWGPDELARYAEAEDHRRRGDAARREAETFGELLAALTPYQRALELYRTLGETRRVAAVHAQIGDVRAESAQVPEAVDHLLRAEQLGREIRALDTVRTALRSLETLRRRTRDFAAQRDALLRLADLSQQIGDPADAHRLRVLALQADIRSTGRAATIVTPLPPGALDPLLDR